MKIFKLPKLAESSADGSFLLGQRETNSNAVSVQYTRLRPGEAPKKVVPAEGTEQIIVVIKGNIRARCGKMDFVVGPGEAFHSRECETFQMENIGSDEAVFIAAGGRAVKTLSTDLPETKEEDTASPMAEPLEAAENEEPEFFITREDEP